MNRDVVCAGHRHRDRLRDGVLPGKEQRSEDNIGRVLAALDAGPHADNIWIILFSDHGFFLGEKQRWAKQALWERATKVPLIIVPPKNRTDEFAVGQVCDQPVELLFLFPTLIEACGLPSLPDQVRCVSLMPLLKNPQADWPHPAITTYTADNHAIRDARFRYIRYATARRNFTTW